MTEINPDFYASLRQHEYRLAACVLADPTCCPGPELPRHLLSDELRHFLSLVPLAMGRWKLLARLAWLRCDREYLMCVLRQQTYDRFLFQRLSGYYAERLRAGLETEATYYHGMARIKAYY